MTDDGYERLPTDQLLEMLYEVDTNDLEPAPVRQRKARKGGRDGKRDQATQATP